MKLDKYNIATLKSILNGIEQTLEICDLYLDSGDIKNLKNIIKKLESD